LITEGGPEEAAKLLWEAARGKEPWAIQLAAFEVNERKRTREDLFL
jgi:hypothetical protein